MIVTFIILTCDFVNVYYGNGDAWFGAKILAESLYEDF